MGIKVSKSILILPVLIYAVFFSTTSAALAGSWFQITASDTVGNGVWSAQTENSTFTSPHGGFSSTSNLCKTCHAVHEAGGESFRLLKDGSTSEGRTQGEGGAAGKGNSRATECMYCHDADSGASILRPYEMVPTGKTVRGEHTLGASVVPDSDINGGLGGSGNLPDAEEFGCYNCHSVHGAKTINGLSYNSSDAFENWNMKILRLDPGGDGTILAKGSGGLTAGEWETELQADPSAVRTGFCADCHNRNPNWARTTDDTDRPNKRSHPQGTGIDSLLQVDNVTRTVAAHPLQKMGCRGCHYASDRQKGDSRFPHQSSGWKFLYDEATMSGSSNLAGEPTRIIPKMDEVCLSCHAVFTDIDDSLDEEAACLICHDSKYNAPDVGDEIRKTSNMGTVEVAGRHQDITETAVALGAGNRHAECDDCHIARQILPWIDNPLTAVWGVTISGAESTNTTPSLGVADTVTAQWQLCFKCHSSWTTVPNSDYYNQSNGTTYSVGAALAQGNKAFEFNTKNTAFHPVRAVGRNQSSVLNDQLLGGLTTTSTLECTDCHNSNSTGDEVSEQGKAWNSAFRPKGPHGSAFSPILRANYLTDVTVRPSEYDPNDYEFCFLCHDSSKLLDPTAATAKTNFNTTLINLHWTHVIGIATDTEYPGLPTGNFSGMCRYCHYNIHSNQQANNTQYEYINPAGASTVSNTPIDGVKSHLVNFAPTMQPLGFAKPRWSYRATAVNNRRRYCNLSCHGNSMTTRYYTPASAGDDVGTY